MFLKKTPKPKGTYLAITESYYDKEKKATRQKTIMGLGYLEELRLEYPDPICKLCLNGMPVPLLRNGYSIFNGTKYR